MGEAILVGLLVNAVFSLKANIFDFFKSKEERKQAEFVLATIKKMEGDLQAVTNWNNTETLERIGQTFIDNFGGDINDLKAVLNDHKSEIMGRFDNVTGL